MVLSDGLIFASEFLDFVLKFLFGLSVGNDFGLGDNSLLDESVLRFELSERVFGVVDQSECGGLASSELGSLTEDHDKVGRGVELFGNAGLDVFLGEDLGVFVEDFNHELFSVQ